MEDFEDIKGVSEKIKSKLNSDSSKIKISILYAFNGAGKTRLSNEFINLNEEDDSEKIKTLCYNAFFEDNFRWDNIENFLIFDINSWEFKLIKDEGLDKSIIENFKNILNTKIEPEFDFEEGKIKFYFPSDEDKINIKISRGEESTFIWSIFHTILELAIEELNSKIEDRSTEIFNNLEYIIIDDPVSSIDDTRIITQAIEIISLIRKANESSNLKFLITTHHPLFYNIFWNSFKRDKRYKESKYILSKNETNFTLKKQEDDSPFGYHLLVKNEIKKAIDSGDIQRYHFNLFRGLLEKTANFLGYGNWYDCIVENKRQESMRAIHLYSHGKLSEMESKHVPDNHKNLFKDTFSEFIKEFRWKTIEDDN